MASSHNSAGDGCRRFARSSDEELLGACFERQPGSLHEFYCRCWQPIEDAAAEAIKTAPQRTTVDADDLRQEFWLEMLQQEKLLFDNYKAARGPLQPLVFTVARRAMLKYAHAKQACWQDRMEHLDEGLLREIADGSDDTVLAKTKLSEHLEAVDENLREVLRLYFGLDSGHDMTLAELANLRHCSVWQASCEVHRALDAIRESGDSMEDQSP